MTTTCFYYHVARLMEQMARLLEKPADAERFHGLAIRVQQAFQRQFFDESRASYGPGSEASNAVPLALNVVPTQYRDAVLRSLVDEIGRQHGRLSTGIIGTRGVSEALARSGRIDLMFALATQTEYPGWGFQIKNGATTVWESLGVAPKLSLNMKMFCNASRFLHQEIAGLAPLEPAYERVRVRPGLVDGLDSAQSWQHTIAGPLAVDWNRGGGKLVVAVELPVGIVGEIQLPGGGGPGARVTESGSPLWQQEKVAGPIAGITSARAESGDLIVVVGSGRYEFEVAPSTGGSRATGRR